jgi:hypothetical protein
LYKSAYFFFNKCRVTKNTKEALPIAIGRSICNVVGSR